MPKITRDQVRVPADVMPDMRDTYVENYMKATRGTGRLMLFACDQKVEHLNKDFYGEGIDLADAEPEHLFKIGDEGVCGVLAGQRGLVAQYANDYPEINYLIKMNSKTNLVGVKQDDPYSPQLTDLDAVLAMRDAGVNIVGLGYTIYLGSEYEATMMSEAGELIAQAHANGLLVVLWIYPRGKAVTAEKDPDLIAGAAGVALCLGADFVKVNPPKPEDGRTPAEALKIAAMAAGRTGLVCAGGSTVDAETFLTQLHDQIHIGGACGNATGRNIHQRSLDEAVRLTKAISAITLADYSVDDALAVFNGEKDFPRDDLAPRACDAKAAVPKPGRPFFCQRGVSRETLAGRRRAASAPGRAGMAKAVGRCLGSIGAIPARGRDGGSCSLGGEEKMVPGAGFPHPPSASAQPLPRKLGRAKR